MNKQYIEKTSFKEVLEKSSRYTIVFRDDEIEECLPAFLEIEKGELTLEDITSFLLEFFNRIQTSDNFNLGHKYFDTNNTDDVESISSDSFLTFPKFCSNVFNNMKEKK